MSKQIVMNLKEGLFGMRKEPVWRQERINGSEYDQRALYI
jgi:hypothetical protein